MMFGVTKMILIYILLEKHIQIEMLAGCSKENK